MRRKRSLHATGVSVVMALASLLLTACGGGGGRGATPPLTTPPPAPSLPTTAGSSQTAYVSPVATGWQVVPLLTVGDVPVGSSYEMAGKPDGLGAIAGRYSSSGALADADAFMTVFMNHELPDTRGAVRAHGTKGAFVSQWTVDLDTLRVTEGRDLVTRVFRYAGGAWADATGTTAFDRLCSADLPTAGALYNAASGNGYDGRLFIAGEEVVEGRAFAHVVGGAEHGFAYELPSLGKYSHENVLLHPASGDTTLAVSQDDDGPGQLYVYVGTKSKTGNAVERAGLHGGKLYGVRVTDGGANYSSGTVARENRGAINGRFELVDVADAALGTGAALQAVSVARAVTEFARPEDGAWDTRNPRVFYQATTGQTLDGATQTARLYKLVFDSVDRPTGGTIEVAVDAATLTGADATSARGFDNVAVDAAGRVLVQEDDGDDVHLAALWLHDPATGGTVQVLEADRNRFESNGSGFLTRAEELSGVIEVTEQVRGANWFDAGRRYYLGTLQAHYPLTEALFEGGQFYLFAAPQ